MLTVNKTQLEATLVKESFFDFFLRFWPIVSSEELVLNWHIELLCNECQAIVMRAIGEADPDDVDRAKRVGRTPRRKRESKLYDLVVNVPPGSTKSTIISVMLPAWCWLHDPTFRTICGSNTDDLAMYLADQCQRLIESEKFQTLFPDFKLRKNSGHEMVTVQGGWRYATSTGGSCIGRHAHLQVIDDPIKPQDAGSEAMLKSANKWMDHTLPSRSVSKRVTVLILVMQRLSQDDPTGHKLAKQGGTPVRHICLPATATDKIRPRSFKRFYKDGLFDPVRLNMNVLDAIREGDMGTFAYAGQYLQEPIPSGGAMFLTNKLEIVAIVPELLRKTFVRSVRYWDKAGTPKGGAYTVGVLMGRDKEGVFWIVDVVRGQWDSATRETIIKQTAELDGRRQVVAIEREPGSGGKESAEGTVKRLAGFRVWVDRPVGDKVQRADPFSTQVNSGNVKLVKGQWNDAFKSELQHFPDSKYKDQVDAADGAFAMLTGRRVPVGALFR